MTLFDPFGSRSSPIGMLQSAHCLSQFVGRAISCLFIMGNAYTYPSGPDSCEGVNDPCPKIQSPSNAGLVVLYAFWTLVGITYACFHIYRSHMASKNLDHVVTRRSASRDGLEGRGSEMTNISALHKDSSITKTDIENKLLDNPNIMDAAHVSDIVQRPYCKNSFGTMCHILWNLISVSWVLMFLIIIIDYYIDCQVKGIDNLCYYGTYPIFGDFETSSNYFFTVWCLSLTWYATCLICKDQLSLWFMLPCSMAEATHMYIWTKDEITVESTADTLTLVLWIRELRLKFTPKYLQEGHEEIVPIKRGDDNIAYFIFEATRYSYVQSVDSFVMPNMDVSGDKYSDFHDKIGGLTDLKVQLYASRFGKNKIPFERKSIYALLQTEVFTFFYFYQFIMYIVWFWFSYLIVASVEASVVILGAAVSVFIQWKNQKTIASLTEYETTVTVKRDGELTDISSDDIVPGDVIHISKIHWVLPCDMVLLSGSCILNESGLTGESMPVQKTSCVNEYENYDAEGNGVRHTIFAGTTVLQLDGDKDGKVIALVTRTSTGTSKGQLISTILYPEQLRFRYEEELEVVIVLLLIYGIVAFALSCYLQDYSGSYSHWITKWAYGMFTVSQIFSPLLPVALKVGQIRSSQRLSEKKIFCINPRRIAISGKVSVFCFDKTGTLTKEGMEFSGVSMVDPDTKSLSQMHKVSSESKGLPPLVVHCMATCHSVAKYGENEYVGNEVEVKMFTSTGWALQQLDNVDYNQVCSPDASTTLKVLRKYEFDHARQTMSVVVEDADGVRHVFCKGSFEKIEDLCDKGTVPDGFTRTARGHALNGGYVLGFAHRVIPSDIGTSIESISRDDIEIHESFSLLGLMIFRNEPKDDSRDAILLLRDGAVRPVMITGDNAQCGQYISRSCGLVDDTSRILLAETDKSTGSVYWSFMGGGDEGTFSTEMVIAMINQENSVQDAEGLIELAVSGNDTLKTLETGHALDILLIHIRIFARTSPDSKSMLVKRFRYHGYIVGMCGDGGNDCGALRAAHAGIALSEAEASVVSPFTSHTRSPMSVVDLVKEGRASLATSFANYKFLIMYGLLFSVVKLCSFYYGVLMSSMSYYCIDGVAITSLCYSMTLSEPVALLSKKRPTASLLGPTTVASCLGVFVLSFVCLVSALGMMKNHPEYVKWPAEYASSSDWWTLSDNWEGTVLYAVMFLFLVCSAGIFSFGYQFRKPSWRNIPLVVNISVLFTLTTLILLMDANDFSDMWHIASYRFNCKDTVSPVWEEYQLEGGRTSGAMDFSFRLGLYALIMSFILLSIFWQSQVMEGFIGDFLKAKYPIKIRPPVRF